MSTFVWPSLVRGSSVVRGFEGQNISSQKPRTREVLLYRPIKNPSSSGFVRAFSALYRKTSPVS